MKRAFLTLTLLFQGLSTQAFPLPGSDALSGAEPERRIERRSFVCSDTPQGWGGLGICYGPQRDGQRPGGPMPSDEQIREDLHIIVQHWSVLRMYTVRDSAEQACRIIRDEHLPLKVLAGAWIAQESKPDPDGKPTSPNEQAADANRAEVAAAIKLANDFPDVVYAVNIGNEALVSWSDHRVPTSVIIGYLRQARAATRVPVTTCDTDLFWTTPESTEVAAECDFLALHAYAMWNRQTLRNSMTWTRERIQAVHAMHPDLPIVITELGWATTKGTEGDQAKYIIADANEQDQELFYRAFRDWAIEQRQPYFYFEAFDENWKGSNEPNEVEKHWGVFNADRSPKLLFKPRAGPAMGLGK